MNYTSAWISYKTTGAFSKLATDYLEQNTNLQSFYKYPVSDEGIAAAMVARRAFENHREVLVTTLQQQYQSIQPNDKVKTNIQRLLNPNTFTVCTAHQPNIFTGYLYFLYKIIHTIKLADELKEKHPDQYFVPVYYMGSEDNDLDELNHIFLDGEPLVWTTQQKGAVGRMKTTGLELLIERINGQLSIHPHGPELITALKEAYLKSASIQEATLKFVNYLFGDYGLVILIPDHVAFKKLMIPIFEDDIFNNTASTIVKTTATALATQYHAQVNPREINLFYMNGNIRERIIQEGRQFVVNNTDISFTAETLRQTLREHPEYFSPNVVLRGLTQETILPNIAFIGGGSEIAYWLELQQLFNHYEVPYPVLILRNSFLVVNEEMNQLRNKLSISFEDIFKPTDTLLNELVLRNSNKQLGLNEQELTLRETYRQMEVIAGAVDFTLANHVKALFSKVAKSVTALERKMLRAEKKTYAAQQEQLKKLKTVLFPNNNLQERVDNLLPYYAMMGRDFIKVVYDNSPTLHQQFGILVEN